MDIPEIRQVKREIRTLGVSASRAFQKGYIVLGAVYRGTLCLDGVIKTTAREEEITDRTIEAIKTSRHHPQVRAILLDGDLFDGASIDPILLSRGALKPVIALNMKEKPRSDKGVRAQAIDREISGGRMAYSVGLDIKVASRVLRVAARDGDRPEALRVAEILLSAYTESMNISFKNDSIA